MAIVRTIKMQSVTTILLIYILILAFLADNNYQIRFFRAKVSVY